ncbi:MAG: DoxX family protein [Candidatus Heimdallarchaeota archaeon]|nr:DoxX family protein [Candidatus Heimdallarchaeota archaeon]
MQSIDTIISNNNSLNKLDQQITQFLDRYGLISLRYSLGIIFIWFGALKPFDKSPANELVENTIVFIPPEIFIPILGIWEIMIGVGLIIRRFNRIAIFLLFLQMPGTMLPLILLPEVCYVTFPFVLTIEGQYIIKNLVLISAAIVIGGTVRKPSDGRYF